MSLKQKKVLQMQSSAIVALAQWFPAFFISRPPSKIWRMCSAPAIICKLKCSNNNRQDKKHLSFHALHSLYLHSYANQASTYANQWDDWACIYTTTLKILGNVLVRAKLVSFSTSSSLFLDFCFSVDKVENPTSQTGWILEFRGLRQTLRKVPWNSWGAPLAHFHVIVALFWKTYDLLQILWNVAVE